MATVTEILAVIAAKDTAIRAAFALCELPPPPPPPPIDGVSPPTGVYVSSTLTSSTSHSVMKGDVERPFVKGVLVRVKWADLEPTQVGYDWSLLDAELDRADSYGTKVTLAVLNGPASPTWLEAAGAQMFAYTFRGVAGAKMPVPWDAVYLDVWTDFITALGERYSNRPTITLVHITHSTYNGFEMGLSPARGGEEAWVAAGYTRDKLVWSWQDVIDAFWGAFPNKPLDVEVHPIFNGEDGTIASDIVDYGSAMLGKRFGVFAAWWSQNHAVNVYPAMFEIIKQAAATSFATVQFVASAVKEPDRFTGIIGTNPSDALVGAINLALSNGVRYLEIWNADIQAAEFQQILTDAIN